MVYAVAAARAAAARTWFQIVQLATQSRCSMTLPALMQRAGTAAVADGSAGLVPERQHPTEQAEDRSLAPALLRATAGDLTTALSGEARQSGDDIERAEKQNNATHAARVLLVGATELVWDRALGFCAVT